MLQREYTNFKLKGVDQTSVIAANRNFKLVDWGGLTSQVPTIGALFASSSTCRQTRVFRQVGMYTDPIYETSEF